MGRRALVLTLLLLAMAPSQAWGGEAVPIEGVGRWALPELGSGPIELSTNGDADGVGIPIEFAKDAFQPKEESAEAISYLSHLDVRVTVDRRTGSGVATFSAVTNGCVGDMINVHVKARPHRDPLISWSTTDLLHGTRGHTGTGRTLVIRGANYVPFCGVRPGPSQLVFELQRFRGVKLKSAVVLASSGLETTLEDAPHLELKSDLSSDPPEVGDEIAIAYTLENVGDRPAHRAFVRLSTSFGGVKVVDGGTRKLYDITNSKSGTIRAVAVRPGPFEIELQAGAGNANNPYGVIRGEVAPRGAGDSFSSAWLFGLWAAAVVAGGFFVRRVWRRDGS